MRVGVGIQVILNSSDVKMTGSVYSVLKVDRMTGSGYVLGDCNRDKITVA